MAQLIDLGKLRFDFRGDYNPNTTYEFNDIVKYNANVYVYIYPTAGSGTVPTTAGHWDLVIEGVFPSQTNNANAILKTNGTTTEWTDGPTLEAITVLSEAIVNGDVTTTYREMSITDRSLISNEATITTDGPHLFDVDDAVVISGLSASSLNGTHTITEVPSSTTFKFASTGTDVSEGAESGTATVYGRIISGSDLIVAGDAAIDGTLDVVGNSVLEGEASVYGNMTVYGDVELEHDVDIRGDVVIGTDVYQVSAKQLENNVATLTVVPYVQTGAHGIDVGDNITVEGVDSTFNADDVEVTAITNTTVSYAKTAGNVANTPSSGTISQRASLQVDNNLQVGRLATFGSNVSVHGPTHAEGGLFVGADAITDATSLGENVKSISTVEILNNEAIITTTEPHGFFQFLFVTIELSPASAIFSGEHEISEVVDAYTFKYSKTNEDVAEASVTGTASSYSGYTNAAVAVSINADDYAQIAFRNASDAENASTDFIAYANNGSDFAGYIDMGITSSNFSDPEFTITGANDGYIFMDAPVGTTGAGNLVLATGGRGQENRIVFAAGGLDSDSTQMEVIPNQSVVIAIPTESTSSTTGALIVSGGAGIQGNLNVEGNVDIQGTITFGGSGTTVETENLAVADPMIFLGTGNSSDILDLSIVGEYAETLVSAKDAFLASSKSLTSNVATIVYEQTASDLIEIGDYVTITGEGYEFDGTFLVTAVTPPSGSLPTASFALVSEDVASTPTQVTTSFVVSKQRKFAGIARDSSDGVVKFFSGATTKPSSTVNFAEAGVTYSGVRFGTVEAGSITSSGTLSLTDANATHQVAGSASFTNGLSASGTSSFSSNVSITGRLDVQEIREDVIDATIISNELSLDYSTGNIFFLIGAPIADFKNFVTNVPTDNGKTMSLTILVTQGSTGRKPTSVMNINGSDVDISWSANIVPTPTSFAGAIDIFSFTIIRRADEWTVLGASSLNFR